MVLIIKAGSWEQASDDNASTLMCIFCAAGQVSTKGTQLVGHQEGNNPI